MKTKLILVLVLVLLMACNKDDGPQQETKVEQEGKIEKSGAKQITGFAFRAADNTVLESDVIGTIDQPTSVISATVPTGTVVTALTPDMQFSAKATINPEGTADFTEVLSYTVTAEDGTTAIYNTTITIAPSNEKQILDFRFEGIDDNGTLVDINAEIDEDTKTIMATMPRGTDVSALEPIIEVSPEATLDLEGPQDFTEPINYIVTAGDGTSTTYVAMVTTALTEKEILLKISEANPENDLEWNENMDLKDFEKVITNDNGQVIQLDIYDQELTILPAEIGQLENLEVLNIDYNDLCEIPMEIGQLLNLKRINLNQNWRLRALPPEIGQLANLEEMYINNNDLQELPSQIGQLTNLKFLHLQNNDLTELPSEIGGLTNLIELYLSNNQRLSELPVTIGQLINMESLLLASNNLQAIPAEIGQLIKLDWLNLESNDIQVIPTEIGQLNNLKYLILSKNNIGAIPSEIGLLSNLVTLNLRSQENGLAMLPKELGNLTKLERLQLADNGLLGLPGEVCDLERNGTTEIDVYPGLICSY